MNYKTGFSFPTQNQEEAAIDNCWQTSMCCFNTLYPSKLFPY